MYVASRMSAGTNIQPRVRVAHQAWRSSSMVIAVMVVMVVVVVIAVKFVSQTVFGGGVCVSELKKGRHDRFSQKWDRLRKVLKSVPTSPRGITMLAKTNLMRESQLRISIMAEQG